MERTRGTGGAKGFSLVELMVVIAVLILLLALLVPSLAEARRSARAGKCASNLHHIATALGSRKIMEINPQTRRLLAGAWSVDLAAHMSRNVSDVFLCPEDLRRGQQLGAMIAVFDQRGTYLYNMELEEGEFCQVRNASGNTYELWFEDIRPSGGDRDYNDVVLRVTVLSETKAMVEVISKSAGYRFDLLLMDGTLVATDLKAGVPVTIVARVPSSYGMNSLVGYKPLEPSTLLVLDYHRAVASVAGPNRAVAEWDAGLAGTARVAPFARHPGKTVNVLRVDGAVEPYVRPVQVDPNVPANRVKYWGE